MWTFGRRAAAGLLPRTAFRASAWVRNPRGRELIETCGRRGLHVTANADATRHYVSTRAAGLHTGAQAASAPMPGTRSAHAPGRTEWTRARRAEHARCLRRVRSLAVKMRKNNFCN